MHIAVFDDMSQCTTRAVEQMLPQVSAQRREQALRYQHTLGQFCCLKSWLMLRELLDEGLPVTGYGNWEYNEHGKPSFPHNLSPITHHPCFFSISHCKEGIAVAVDNQPIGIDIEAIRHAEEDLIKRTMNEAERKLIANANAKANAIFTRLWTQKEAVVKCQGTGITSFEQLQSILENQTLNIETIEKEKYIYSIAYGKLHCFSA